MGHEKKLRSSIALELTGAALLVCLSSLNGPLTQAGQTGSQTTGQASTQASTPVPAPQNPGGFVIRSQVNMVLVDVRVTDKSGRPITDLKREDFKLSEDGAPQSITSFSLENIERLETATDKSGPPPTIDLAKLPPNVPPEQVIQDHRLIVLFFDLTSMPVDDLMRASKAATDFVNKQLTPADLVAVATYSSTLRVAQTFTNDHDALDKALRS